MEELRNVASKRYETYVLLIFLKSSAFFILQCFTLNRVTVNIGWPASSGTRTTVL
jgi:hypothetical protein